MMTKKWRRQELRFWPHLGGTAVSFLNLARGASISAGTKSEAWHSQGSRPISISLSYNPVHSYSLSLTS